MMGAIFKAVDDFVKAVLEAIPCSERSIMIKKIEENDKKIEENDKKIDENNKKIEENKKSMEANDKDAGNERINKISKGLAEVKAELIALEARRRARAEAVALEARLDAELEDAWSSVPEDESSCDEAESI